MSSVKKSYVPSTQTDLVKRASLINTALVKDEFVIMKGNQGKIIFYQRLQNSWKYISTHMGVSGLIKAAYGLFINKIYFKAARELAYTLSRL